MHSECIGFNVPLDTSYVISETSLSRHSIALVLTTRQQQRGITDRHKYAHYHHPLLLYTRNHTYTYAMQPSFNSHFSGTHGLVSSSSRVRFNVPLDTVYVIRERYFYRSCSWVSQCSSQKCRRKISRDSWSDVFTVLMSFLTPNQTNSVKTLKP